MPVRLFDWMRAAIRNRKQRIAEASARHERYRVYEDGINKRIHDAGVARETGAEMEPPWVVFEAEDPPLNCKQGDAEYYMLDLFLPFWQELKREERIDYLARKNAPEAWMKFCTSEYFFEMGLDPEEVLWRPIWKETIAKDKASMAAGEEIKPPWAVIPGLPANGYSHSLGRFWLNQIWAEYYGLLSKDQRAAYDAKWDWPEEWRERLSGWLAWLEFDIGKGTER